MTKKKFHIYIKSNYIVGLNLKLKADFFAHRLVKTIYLIYVN